MLPNTCGSVHQQSSANHCLSFTPSLVTNETIV